MFLVSFTNMGYSKEFNNIESAIAYMERACFEAVLMTPKGERLGEFRPISGRFIRDNV